MARLAKQAQRLFDVAKAEVIGIRIGSVRLTGTAFVNGRCSTRSANLGPVAERDAR